MAAYTNQIPESLRKGDVLTFTHTVETAYVLTKDVTAQIEMTGGGGGAGAGLLSYTGSVKATGGAASRGGRLACTLFMPAGTYKLAAGTKGANYSSTIYSLTMPLNYSSTSDQADSGGAGKASTIKNASGTTLAQAAGGTGGTGARYSNGSIYNGTAGKDGSATASADAWDVVKSVAAQVNTNGSISITVAAVNEPPGGPAFIEYGRPMAGKPIAVTLGAAVDPDGDAMLYTLERQADSGPWTQVGSQEGLEFQDVVPSSGERLRYRAKATDETGEEGPYLTGPYKDIDYNAPPVISGTDAALPDMGGVFAGHTYRVDDADEQDEVTVRELLDGAELRRYAAVKGADNTLSISGEPWLKTGNGPHTVILSASDGRDTAERRLTFTRKNTRIKAATAQATAVRAQGVALTFSPAPGIWPADAQVTVRVCNDVYAGVEDPGANPHWEELPASCFNGPWYTFTNKAGAEGDWGVGVEILAQQGPSKAPVTIDSVIVGIS